MHLSGDHIKLPQRSNTLPHSSVEKGPPSSQLLFGCFSFTALLLIVTQIVFRVEAPLLSVTLNVTSYVPVVVVSTLLLITSIRFVISPSSLSAAVTPTSGS